MRQDARRDPEQPRTTREATVVAVGDVSHFDERGMRDVFGILRMAGRSRREAKHRRCVAIVNDAERGHVTGREPRDDIRVAFLDGPLQHDVRARHNADTFTPNDRLTVHQGHSESSDLGRCARPSETSASAPR
jgi:hypothetical protein